MSNVHRYPWILRLVIAATVLIGLYMTFIGGLTLLDQATPKRTAFCATTLNIKQYQVDKTSVINELSRAPSLVSLNVVDVEQWLLDSLRMHHVGDQVELNLCIYPHELNGQQAAQIIQDCTEIIRHGAALQGHEIEVISITSPPLRPPKKRLFFFQSFF